MRKTKQCKACKEEIDAKASICPHCHSKQASGGCLQLIILFILVCILISFIPFCMMKTNPNLTGPSSSGSTSGNHDIQVIQYAWRFSENKDDFDGKETQWCIIDSNDYIKAVYGTEKVNLQVRMRNQKETDIIIHVDNVVFGHSGSSDKVRLKFDDDQPFSVGYNEAADGSADTIFLRSTSKIIAKLKTAKKLTLELPVFMESGQRASFNIEGYSEVCKF